MIREIILHSSNNIVYPWFEILTPPHIPFIGSPAITSFKKDKKNQTLFLFCFFLEFKHRNTLTVNCCKKDNENKNQKL